MLDPRIMCKKHILGEHGEIHKHRHNFVKKHSIKGRIFPIVQIEPASMKKRHDELAKYLNHKSEYEMPDISHLPHNQREAKVDKNISISDLSERCEVCRKLMKEAKVI